MKWYEAVETLFTKTDLTFAQAVLNEPFHPSGSRGRPQRNPLGIFKAHLVKRLKHIPSDRMLVRQIWKDPRLKKICDIETVQPPYGIAVLFRFRSKVGPERFSRIIKSDHRRTREERKNQRAKPWRWIQPSSKLTEGEALTIARVSAVRAQGLAEL
jgi:hypothetical protein